MGGYKPIHITGNTTGLVQSREEFILPHDAYPVLQNAFVWRERIKKKQGCSSLGRLQRSFSSVSIGNSAASPWSLNFLRISGYVSDADNANPGQITTTYPHGLSNGDLVVISDIVGATGYNNISFTITVVDPLNFTVGVDASGFGAYTSGGYWISNRTLLSPSQEPNAQLALGSVRIVIGSGGGAITLTDQGNGTLTSVTPGNSGTINYLTGAIVLTHTAGAGVASRASFGYYPSFPAMGVRSRETPSLNLEETIFFDTKYAYRFNGTTFEEFIPGTIWTGDDAEFFWTTNYWQIAGLRLFWETNFSGTAGDPIRYTDGSTWTDFGASSATGTGKINVAGDYLNQSLALLPFRSRLVAFNTYEGASLAGSLQYPQRIRWAAIGNPLTVDAGGPPITVGAWRDDIPGRGGYLDIPTSQSIVSVGFVRDNLIIYCERSTWQLRYTGRSIQPFVVEKVNSELGAESTFSAVQFDTTLVGIGDKGVVECDSYKSERIDIKIPDLIFSFNNDNQGPQRVCGFRDFFQRIAYWMYPYLADDGRNITYPNRRLIYNYDNDSWAIYIDSFTCLGSFQPVVGATWNSANVTWEDANFQWGTKSSGFLDIAGGNQQGFVSLLDQQILNDPTLSITAFDSVTNLITIPNHNLDDGQIISISGIIIGSDYESFNDGIFQATAYDNNKIYINYFNEESQKFDKLKIIPSGTYMGGGMVALRDNFIIQSKKFNFIDQGQNIQLGFIDILTEATESGAISLYILLNYNENDPINVTPQNQIPNTELADTFFNSVVPTFSSENIASEKYMQRVYSQARGNFITIVWTFSPAQMAGNESAQNVQIDAQVMWMRAAGRMTNN